MSDNVDWEELFGSDEEDDDERTLLIENYDNTTQPITTLESIPGLKLIKQALNHNQQMYLINALIQHEYFTNDRNQVMLFGELPTGINWLTPWIMKNYPDVFEKDVLHREPLFDQAILNMYKKGDGILSHVDLLRLVI
jgi:hypothetical protein